MKFIRINRDNRNKSSQPELHRKTGYAGNLIENKIISKKSNILITGNHHSGKTRAIVRLFEHSQDIWESQIKPYAFTKNTKALANDKPVLTYGEAVADWIYPKAVFLGGNDPLSKWTDHDAMARFSLATGLRESNVTQLEWSEVDLQRRCAWIHADQAKAGKSIAVPLNDDAMAVLRSQISKHETNVFTYKNKPVGVANTKAWRAALVRAGISDFRWHDLRHTWASWHVQNGTPLHALKELGGWADLTMVLRYAHLSSEHLSEFAENAKVGTNKLHAQKSPDDRKAVRA